MKRIIFLLGLLVFILSACTLFAPSEESIRSAIEQTQAAQPTATPTTEPTEEPEPVEAEAAAPEAEPAAEELDPEAEVLTAAASFTDANVYSVSFPQDGVFLVTVEVPGGVEEDYHALLDRKEYKCQVLEQYPDRLYCSGEAPEINKLVFLQVILTGTDEVVFEAEIGVPAVVNLPTGVPVTGGNSGGKSTQPAPEDPPQPPPEDPPPPPPEEPPPPPDPDPYPYP